MGLSTKIEDLPGGPGIPQQQQQPPQSLQPQQHSQPDIALKEQETHITAEIKKVEEKQNLTFFQKLMSEENMLFLILLFAASLPQVNMVLQKFPFINQANDNNWMFAIVKSALLFGLFVATKTFLL